MVAVTIVVREVGRVIPNYFLRFDLPAVPTEGSYISIHRPDKPEPYGEDMIVRKIWWRLEHPETRALYSADEEPRVGRMIEIFVECAPALGPYSSDAWRQSVQHGVDQGQVQEFEISRFAIRESEYE